MPQALAYRDFYYPLNVFMHILTAEEGAVSYLHYGLFERDDEPIARAQERSTELLFSRLPAPPARLLDVGSGLGTTLRKLAARGYRATGITPDAKQIALIGDGVDVRCVAFEDMPEAESEELGASEAFDAIIFQESSQYIDSERLFAKARALTRHVVVLDEFTIQPAADATLHALDRFLAAAAQNGFEKVEDLDVSDKAAPTIDYFTTRLPRFREALIADLGLSNEQVDALIDSGARYRDFYRRGIYGYRLLQFRR
jgi:SAM-dependent methyltransferase